MTNYCQNRVTIEGSAAEIQAFARDCLCLKEGLDVLDFEKIHSVPAEVKGLYRHTASKLSGRNSLDKLSSGWVGMEALLRKLPPPYANEIGRSESVLDRDFVKERGIGSYDDLNNWLLQNDPTSLDLGRKCLAAFEACGNFFEDDWVIGEWGCDPDRVEYSQASLSETRYEAVFMSPWGAPEGIFREIARRHRGLTGRFAALEEGNDYSFLLTTSNNTIREERPEITDRLIDDIEGAGEVESRIEHERAVYDKPSELRKQPTRRFRYWLAERRLKRALVGYPVYVPPHLGVEWTMPEQQARENFEFFLAQRNHRIDILKRFLAQFDVSLDFTDSAKLALDRWIASYGALLFVPETGFSFWTHRPEWAGARSGLNVIFDVAIYIGEFAVVESPELRWSMDVRREKGRTRSDHGFQRPTIDSAGGLHSFPRDVIDATYGICHSLCENSYMRKQPLYTFGSPPLALQFVTKMLRHIHLSARGDFETANNEWAQDSYRR